MSVGDTTSKVVLAGVPTKPGAEVKYGKSGVTATDCLGGKNTAENVIKTTKKVVQSPYDFQALVASGNKTKQIFDTIDKCSKAASTDKTSFLQYMYKDKDLRNFLFDPKTKTTDGVKVDGFKFFPPETLRFMENKCPNSKGVISTISAIDKNLLDTKFGQSIVKSIDKNAKITLSGTQNVVSGSKGAVFAADTLGKMPILSLAVSAGLEIPELMQAYKNGDLDSQIARSATNVVCTGVASAAMGTIMAPLCPPFGSIAGFTIGSYLGHKVSKSVGDKFLGQSIEEQKTENQKVVKSNTKPQTHIA